MNRRPHEPLDAEERALLARLPRAPGRSQPPAALDASILAAASAAVHAKPARKPRRSWIVPISVAATVTVAAGLAWQLQPPGSVPMDRASPVAATQHVQQVQMAEVAAADEIASPAFVGKPSQPMAVESVAAPPAPTSAPSEQVDAAAQASDASARAVSPVVMAAPPPAPPPPAAPRPAIVEPPAIRDVPLSAAAAPVAAPPMAEAAPAAVMSRTSEAQPRYRASQQKAASAETGGAASPARNAKTGNEAERATAAPQAFAQDAFEDDDVPPATVDAPGVRDARLRRIIELRAQGKLDEAKESLGVFRHRYPNATLPAELRDLDPAPAEPARD